MYKLVLFFVVIFVTTFKTQAQLNQNSINTTKEFGLDEGFLPYYTNNLIFDNHNWLWIVGRTLNASSLQFQSSELVMQRFDGHTFYNIQLPKKELKSFNEIVLIKRNDGNFYVLFSKGKNHYLYLINAKTLQFTEVEFFNQTFNTSKTVQIFLNKKDYLVIGIGDKGATFYNLSNVLKLTKLVDVPSKKGHTHYFSNFMPVKNGYHISNLRSGVYFFDTDWNFKKLVNPKEIPIHNGNLTRFKIKERFYVKDTLYALFNSNNRFFKYHQKKDKWLPASVFNQQNYTKLYGVNKEQFVGVKVGKRYSKIHRYINAYNTPIVDSISLNTGSFKFASRDIAKELFFTNKGKLYRLTFKNKYVKTYLNGYSIRSIYPFAKNTFLVGTQNEGWFQIDTLKKKVKPYQITYNNTKYKPGSNVGFEIKDSTLWSNNATGVVEVDMVSKKIKSYVYYPTSCMTFDKDQIYYGTHNYKLMQFDKKRRKNIVLANTDTLSILDIVKLRNTIFGATNKGLLLYQNKRTSLLKPTTKDSTATNNLIALDVDEHFGILVGTVDGKLYQFNPKTATFKLLYKDKLQSTIVSATSLNSNVLWLHTFSGCIKYNVKTKNSIRYGEDIGLSNNEANRYSFLKTKDSTFFVGTVSGLNVFNPYKIIEKKDSLHIALRGLGFFDKQKNNWKFTTAPQNIMKKHTIVLPAQNRRLKIAVSTTGASIGKVNYEYKMGKHSWVSMQTNQVDFAEVSTGNNTLLLRAKEGTGKISNILALQIKSKSFFYNQWWFYLVLIIFVAGLTYYIFNELRVREMLKLKASQNLIVGQEEERKRISRELHDGIGQNLLLIKNAFRKNKIQDTDLVDATINEVRALTQFLHPFQFKQLGLINSLKNNIQALQRSSKIFYSENIENPVYIIPYFKAIVIYRMIQECLHNVEKHSNAEACNLSLIETKEYIEFIVKDDGKGFTVKDKINATAHLGLKTLQERADILDAELTITSKKDKGTVTKIRIKK